MATEYDSTLEASDNYYPGTIVGEDLELEKGGSGLLYPFDIMSGSATQ